MTQDTAIAPLTIENADESTAAMLRQAGLTNWREDDEFGQGICVGKWSLLKPLKVV